MDGVGLRDRLAEALELRRAEAVELGGEASGRFNVLTAMSWAVDALFEIVRQVPRDSLPDNQAVKDAAATLYRTHIEPIDLPYVPNRVIEPLVDRALSAAFVAFVDSSYTKFLAALDEDPDVLEPLAVEKRMIAIAGGSSAPRILDSRAPVIDTTDETDEPGVIGGGQDVRKVSQKDGPEVGGFS